MARGVCPVSAQHNIVIVGLDPTIQSVYDGFSMAGRSENHYYVYIMASRRNGTLYTGVTNNLIRRANEHRSNAFDSFSKRYKTHSLVYYEYTTDIDAALNREKQIKKWYRKWKLELIEKTNPEWKDLWEEIAGG